LRIHETQRSFERAARASTVRLISWGSSRQPP
jgi:hypothetical protein